MGILSRRQGRRKRLLEFPTQFHSVAGRLLDHPEFEQRHARWHYGPRRCMAEKSYFGLRNLVSDTQLSAGRDLG